MNYYDVKSNGANFLLFFELACAYKGIATKSVLFTHLRWNFGWSNACRYHSTLSSRWKTNCKYNSSAFRFINQYNFVKIVFFCCCVHHFQGYVMGDDTSVSMKGSETRQRRKVIHFVPHPEFERETFKNDIAVIRVSEFNWTELWMWIKRKCLRLFDSNIFISVR